MQKWLCTPDLHTAAASAATKLKGETPRSSCFTFAPAKPHSAPVPGFKLRQLMCFEEEPPASYRCEVWGRMTILSIHHLHWTYFPLQASSREESGVKLRQRLRILRNSLRPSVGRLLNPTIVFDPGLHGGFVGWLQRGRVAIKTAQGQTSVNMQIYFRVFSLNCFPVFIVLLCTNLPHFIPALTLSECQLVCTPQRLLSAAFSAY